MSWIFWAKACTALLFLLCVTTLIWGARTQRKALRISNRESRAMCITPMLPKDWK